MNLTARKNKDVPSLTITDDSENMYTARRRLRQSETTLFFLHFTHIGHNRIPNFAASHRTSYERIQLL